MEQQNNNSNNSEEEKKMPETETNNNNDVEVKEEESADPKANLQRLFQKQNKHHQQDQKIIAGDDGEKRSIFKDLTDKTTLHFKSDNNSMYHIDRDCVKVLIENCKNCRVVFNARVRTEVVEIWNCENLEIVVNKASIKTLQVDLTHGFKATFKSTDQFQEMIWAGVSNIDFTVGKYNLTSGIDEVIASEEFKDKQIDPKIDQFIVRVVNGKLLQELIVRLPGGFPTTDREADEFDRRQKQNDEKYEAFVRKLLSNKGVEGELQELQQLNEKKDDEPENNNNNDNIEVTETPKDGEEKKE